jgi:hypothetical protein
LIDLVVMATFFVIVWWAYAPSRKALWERRGELRDDA